MGDEALRLSAQLRVPRRLAHLFLSSREGKRCGFGSGRTSRRRAPTLRTRDAQLFRTAAKSPVPRGFVGLEALGELREYSRYVAFVASVPMVNSAPDLPSDILDNRGQGGTP
jgi:hypothetical protein